jgi:hypothetical protein
MCYSLPMADLSLYLRPEEKQIFDALDDDIKDGWKVEDETIEYSERPEELKMRSLMFKSDDENLIQSLEKARSAKTAEEVQGVFEELKSLPQSIALEAFFTLGVSGLASFISSVLGSAKTDDDLQGVSELSMVRHALLESNTEVSSPS